MNKIALPWSKHYYDNWVRNQLGMPATHKNNLLIIMYTDFNDYMFYQYHPNQIYESTIETHTLCLIKAKEMADAFLISRGFKLLTNREANLL